MATSIDQKNFVKTALRLPPELHATVHEAAQKNGRSYNGELVDRIQNSFIAPTADADALANYSKQLQYDLAATKLELTLVASLCATVGRMLKQSVDALEERRGVPVKTLAAVRAQAEEASRVANKYGFDPHKHLAELEQLVAQISSLPNFDLVNELEQGSHPIQSSRQPKP